MKGISNPLKGSTKICLKGSATQTYDIPEDIYLYGYSTTSLGACFDDGQIEITAIDETVNYTISGRIWGITNEGTSTVSGNFTLEIER